MVVMKRGIDLFQIHLGDLKVIVRILLWVREMRKTGIKIRMMIIVSDSSNKPAPPRIPTTIKRMAAMIQVNREAILLCLCACSMFHKAFNCDT